MIVIAFTGQGGRRVLAVVSAGTLAATIFYVAVGGPLMLATWLTVATLAIALADLDRKTTFLKPRVITARREPACLRQCP